MILQVALKLQSFAHHGVVFKGPLVEYKPSDWSAPISADQKTFRSATGAKESSYARLEDRSEALR